MSNKLSVVGRFWKWLFKWFVRRCDYDIAVEEHDEAVKRSICLEHALDATIQGFGNMRNTLIDVAAGRFTAQEVLERVDSTRPTHARAIQVLEGNIDEW